MSSVIFLLGAGASCDAGMPLVAQLTTELRSRLPQVLDINKKRHCEFSALFDAVAAYDPCVCNDYERFFEWLKFLLQAQTGSFRKAISIKIDKRLVDAVPHLVWSIKQPIYEILRDRHQCGQYKPDYLAKLNDFLPKRGRLKVFTTNYDLCLEDACRCQGIDVITGFHPKTGQWTPSLFQSPGPGINLYKLHGSVNWGLSDGLEDLNNRPLIERYPPVWDKEPELLLGPGSKLQYDDPFVTLYAEFHQAISRAKTCVAIGYSFRDDHIAQPIRQARHRGTKVIDVNPCPTIQNSYTKIRKEAKEALESNEILKAVRP